MNQERIGKFILELRKEKNMTQQELANKIGVTDRAISKWENGRGLPDISLMKPLCEVLGITINELISGDRITKKEYQEKVEENILNTLTYSDRKIKNNNKIVKIVISVVIVLPVLLFSMFFIDVRMMNQNKPVIFSTWGYKYTPAVDLHEEEIERTIRHYLVEKNDSEPKHHEGEKSFVAMRTYLIEEFDEYKKFNVYAWVVDGRYYLEGNEIKEDSGSSIPYKFVVEKVDDEYIVTDSRIPRDGSYYSDDMKNIFPRSVRNDMDKANIDGTVEKLLMEIEEQVKLYFHK